MKYSVIDIGTNSVRFMLAEKVGNKITVSDTFKTTTRLGEGLYTPERRLADKPVFDTLCAVKKYADYSRERNADVIICTATSAVRDASNSDEFSAKIKQTAGIELRILSGEEEAYAGFTGAMQDMPDPDNTMLIDIGGGSTEIVSHSKNGLEGTSFECGCVRLNELFKGDYKKAAEYIADVVKPHNARSAVWIGGTASACAMIYLLLNEFSINRVHMTNIPAAYIKRLRDETLAMSPVELIKLCSFDVKRGEILPYGLMIISHILDSIKTDNIVVSEKGLMDGIITLHSQGKI